MKDLKIGIAQVLTHPGKLSENESKIVEYIRKARHLGVDLIIFPELALPGYLVMDLAYNEVFLRELRCSLDRIRKESSGIDIVLGTIRWDETGQRPGGRPMLYNSAAFLSAGEIKGFQDKILLPDYDIFDEHRYFVSGSEFNIFESHDFKIGIEICEDLWSGLYAINPSRELCKRGSELLINISASPFEVGKLKQRSSLIMQIIKDYKVPFVYSNLVGSFDGFDGEVVFDGQSLVCSAKGTLVGVGKKFMEDLLICNIASQNEVLLPPSNEISDIHQALVCAIREYFNRHNFNCAIVGLSGGIDSSLVAALAVEALGKGNVIGISMPSKYTTSETERDAELVAKNLGIKFKTIPIKKSFDVMLCTLREDKTYGALPEDVSEENIQPRLRMTILYAQANKFNGVVLNTGNKTELALGYCTIYGDMAGGLGVLADISKERVYALSEYINKKVGSFLLPRTVIERAPSAELRPNQTDEEGMGARPQDLSQLVDSIVDGMTFYEAKKRYGDRFSDELIEATWRRINLNEWKRRQASPGIRVTHKAFGHGRRFPMGNDFIG